jgi:starch phosphorylase
VPDYRVSIAEKIIPAADLSEQISTAGEEASGTGNMKFAMNGALTIGTLDGANIEMRDEVGPENFFIFGLTAEEVARSVTEGSYRPHYYYERCEPVRRVLDALLSDLFCTAQPGLFRWIFEALVHGGDTYFLLADLESYVDAQAAASRTFCDESLWSRKATYNIARMGKFSSDRTIREYADEIWGLQRIEATESVTT